MKPIVLAMVSAALLTAGPVLTARAENKEDKREELDRIRRQMREKQVQISNTKRREQSILTSLEKIDRQIQEGNKELAEQEGKTREVEAALSEIEQRSKAIAGELPRLQAGYRNRIRALYKMSRSGGYALAVLSADSFASAYRRMRYLGAIAERDQRLIGEYQAALEQLTLRGQEVAALQRELLSQRQAVTKKRMALQDQRRKKAEILSSLKQKKSVHEATLKDLEESSANLWAMIRLAEQDKQPAPRPGLTAGKEQQLPWPVRGKVLTSFGMQRHPQFGTMVFHQGIEIAAREGEEVRAVEAGVVAYADWYKGYGRLVIIDHGSGLYTLYGHLSGVDVRGGQAVAQRQVIGQAGDTGSLKGTKLYFELRRNGAAEDPLSWLAKR
jgi:septal ring factor EnvC (AmiA/AmiB activator)